MNINENQFKPKLSRHELILDRYKTILKSTSSTTESITKISTDKPTPKSNNQTEMKITNKINSLVDNSGIKNYLNEMINASSTNTNKFINSLPDTTLNNSDQIEMIKQKYQMSHYKSTLIKIDKYNNTNNLSQFNIRKLSCLEKIEKSELQSNPFINLIKSNFNDNKNFEIENIKSKYSYNAHNHDNNSEENSSKSNSKTNFNNLNNSPTLDQILSKYKQTEIKINRSPSKILLEPKTVSIENQENGQSSNIFNQSINKNNNGNNNSRDSEVISRIRLLEEKLNQLHVSIIDFENPKNNSKNYVIDIKKEVINTREKIEIEKKLPLSDNIDNNSTANYKIKKIQHLKEENTKKFLEHENMIKKEDSHHSNTSKIINELIENVTGKLFIRDQNPLKESERENEIKIIPNKAKIFKLRTSAPKSVKKKIQSFEEFINSDTEKNK